MDSSEIFKRGCVVCGEGEATGELCRVMTTGLRTLISSASTRNDADVEERINATSTPAIHSECRRKYNDKRQLSKLFDDPIAPKIRRSSVPVFNWMENCCLCSECAFTDERHPDRNPVCRVETLDFGDKILELCRKMESQAGIASANSISIRVGDTDLVAAEARYHQKCYLRLLNTDNNKARPVSGLYDEKTENFLRLCAWLESEGELDLYTVTDLYLKMEELGTGEIYSETYLKQRLERHYGDHVMFASSKGSRKDVICFRNMADYIISDKWYKERRQNSRDDAHRIILAAAKLIREEIRAMPYTKDEYPSLDQYDLEQSDRHLCEGLRIFLNSVINDKLKAASAGHVITQAARPRSVISPIPFGLGVEFHHVFGSEWAINQLYSLGFSVSYDEVTRFRQSVLQQQSLDTLSPPEFPVLAQYGGDNADSNIRTLSGGGTFHAMAHYAWFKADGENSPRSSRIKRLARVDVADLIRDKDIPVMRYTTSTVPSLSTTELVPMKDLASNFNCVFPMKSYYSLILWKSTLSLRNVYNSQEWTNWSGFMHHVYRKDGCDIDETMLLPIIDLNPNDQDCVYSTLCYVSEQARRLCMPSTSITFDQPLFLKAFEIAKSKGLSNLVVRLGGFHLLMSALGSLYATMKGSGVDEALAQVFATNTVPMILSGKAFSRCIRGTHLLSAALNYLLLRNVENTENETGSSLLDDLQRLITETDDPQTEDPLEKIAQSTTLAKLDEILTSTKQTLASNSRTAKLWLQFLHYIDIIDEFIVSERGKHWHGHLNACYKLLNLFAATGHVNYAKCTRLYLQSMSELESDHPWLYRKYVEEGCFAVQRTKQPFNGLWSDLVIEQVVMASLKNSRSGLTHGRGLTESVRQQWIYSLPMYAAFHDAMSQLTQRHRRTSEQHIELGKSRRKIDIADVDRVCEWLIEHDPFTDNPELRSLSTGITASGTDVNCDQCESVGRAIQTKLDNVPYNQAKIARKDTIRTLQHLESGVTVGEKKIQIEPRVLFSRLHSVAQRLDTNIESFLEFEMAISPPSLFDGEMLRKADKSELGRYLLGLVDSPIPLSTPVDGSRTVVVDGGWLLHRVRWTKNMNFDAILDMYVKYVSKLGMSTIVFDGYGEPSTKDHEHRRRQSNSVSATIEVKLNRRCHNDQQLFLANERNKVQFINLLASHLIAVGHSVLQSSSDADTLIAKAALDAANRGEVVLFVEDTDVLVLMIHHFKETEMFDIKLCKFPKNTKGGLLYSIRKIACALIPSVREHVLFVHAWSGCDTTSGTFNHGKLAVMKLLQKDRDLSTFSATFLSEDQERELIGATGQKVFSRMYGSRKELKRVRYEKYLDRQDDPINLDPRKLPPTTRAAHFHSLRVYLQIQHWQKLGQCNLSPTDWGWQLKNNSYSPVRTDCEIAPLIILKSVRCKCKSLERQCATNVCSCRKFGLKCVPACGGCRGESCGNTEPPILDEE